MSIRQQLQKKNWYCVSSHSDIDAGWGKTSDRIFEVANNLNIKAGDYQIQGYRFNCVYASKAEIRHLLNVLGKKQYSCKKMDKFQVTILESQMEATDGLLKRIVDR